jgi:predicted transcriptional regulator
MAKRPDGSLEREVMHCLWRSPRPLGAGAIQSQLSQTLAYTSVATVLTRLHAKGLVSRVAEGRGFVYEPALSESAFVAAQLQNALTAAADSQAVLAQFVGKLSKRDARALRMLLDDRLT